MHTGKFDFFFPHVFKSHVNFNLIATYRVSGYGYFQMALRGRKIENVDDVSLAAGSQELPICVSSTNFQKSSIGWPQQPLTEKVLKFNLIFNDSTPKKYFFKTSE